MNWQRENEEPKDQLGETIAIIRAKDENAGSSTIAVAIKRGRERVKKIIRI